jgi:hypothetical protein
MHMCLDRTFFFASSLTFWNGREGAPSQFLGEIVDLIFAAFKSLLFYHISYRSCAASRDTVSERYCVDDSCNSRNSGAIGGGCHGIRIVRGGAQEVGNILVSCNIHDGSII